MDIPSKSYYSPDTSSVLVWIRSEPHVYGIYLPLLPSQAMQNPWHSGHQRSESVVYAKKVVVLME
jgi:hypothetical protein